MMDLRCGDNREVLPTLAEGSVDAIVCDPPYSLRFMAKSWDAALPGIDTWQACLRVLKPGGYLLAFGGTRTYHRLACAVEDAGLEVRDCIMWLYGSGFPKGRGNLKPAYEPVLLCRRPGKRVRELGIEECRIGTDSVPSHRTDLTPCHGNKLAAGVGNGERKTLETVINTGRWPANIVHDGSEEVLEAFAAFGMKMSGGKRGGAVYTHDKGSWSSPFGVHEHTCRGDSGTAARFFYTSKAGRRERWFYCRDCADAFPPDTKPAHQHGHAKDGKPDWSHITSHPTQKPEALMTWLVKLVARESELVLDPFAGSGTTGVACVQTGRRFIGVEQSAEYHAIAQKRIAAAQAEAGLFAQQEAV